MSCTGCRTEKVCGGIDLPGGTERERAVERAAGLGGRAWEMSYGM